MTKKLVLTSLCGRTLATKPEEAAAKEVEWSEIPPNCCRMCMAQSGTGRKVSPRPTTMEEFSRFNLEKVVAPRQPKSLKGQKELF